MGKWKLLKKYHLEKGLSVYEQFMYKITPIDLATCYFDSSALIKVIIQKWGL
jgi:hypothetical protein